MLCSISSGGGGAYHDFLEKLLSHSAEKFRSVPENFCYRKLLGMREGAGIKILRPNCFVSQYRKTSSGNSSVFHKKFGVEKLYG